MSYHLKRRIEDAAKHDHWAIQWSRKNMSQVAAMMILFGHIKQEKLPLAKFSLNACNLRKLLQESTIFQAANTKAKKQANCNL